MSAKVALMPPQLGYVAIYCRISEDKAGRSEGVEAQESWGREYAAQHWPHLPVEVFPDNDISAAKDDVERPEFERLRECVRAGEVAQLWTVEQSRLTRREPEWFGLVGELVKAGITEIHTRRNGVVRTNDVVGGILAVIDANEVRKLRMRILDRMDTLAQEGRPKGGTQFGYRPGKDDQGRRTLQIHPEEAAVIRESAQLLLNGWSLNSVAKSLRNRGIVGPKGGRIQPFTVRQFVTKPSVAGYRMHRGVIVGRAEWEPILDETTWRSIRAIWGMYNYGGYGSRVIESGSPTHVINDANGYTRTVNRAANRRSGGGGLNRRRYLLTGGTAICGQCGSRLIAGAHSAYPDGYYYCSSYRADHKPTRAGGRCTTIKAPELEGHVASQLLDHLNEPEFRAALLSDEHAERRDEILTSLQDLDGQRVELARMWQQRQVTSQQFTVMNDGIADDERQLQNELAAIPPPPDQSFDPAQLRATWPYMVLDEKRKLVDDWIESVTVYHRKRVTQHDVANRADVARSTVAIITRGHADDAPESMKQLAMQYPEPTRRRVLDAAREVGYVLAGCSKSGSTQRPASERVKIKWKGGSDTA